MDKNDGLKIETKIPENASMKSSIIKDFATNRESSEMKSSFYKSDNISAFTKFSIKTGGSKTTKNEKFYNVNEMNKTNRTHNFRKNNKIYDNSSIGFFNRTSDKFIANSLTIND